MKIFEFDRVAVLSQRMNKCTTGKRFELDELHKKAMDADFFTVHLSDKYSKYGLVGIIEIQDANLGWLAYRNSRRQPCAVWPFL